METFAAFAFLNRHRKFFSTSIRPSGHKINLPEVSQSEQQKIQLPGRKMMLLGFVASELNLSLDQKSHSKLPLKLPFKAAPNPQSSISQRRKTTFVAKPIHYDIFIWRMLRKFFEQYESEEDQDYNPTKLEEALYRQEHDKKKKKGVASNSAQRVYQQAKEEYYLSLRKKVKTDEPQPAPLELAQFILSSDSIKPNKRVVFAGKEFILNEETGQLQIVEKKVSYEAQEHNVTQDNPEEYERRKTHIAYQYLNHVMRAIYNRSRKINSVGKSKLDWKGFVKQEGIQDKLKYNRKGGVIENMHFIKKTAGN